MLGTQYTRSWAGGEANGGVHARFYLEPVQDELATAREGRPIFKQEERVEIFLAGNPHHQPVHRVTDEHRARWPREYEAFKQGLEAPVEGTPIEEWPVLNRAQVLELKALQIHTIEDMASITDTATQRTMGLMGLRAKARAFLDDAAAMALTEQLTKENEDLRSKVSTLEHQVEELGKISQQLHGEIMGMRNAPSPVASVIPGMLDPHEAARQQQAGFEPREVPGSSLAAFVEERRRPGRPRKDGAAVA